MMGHHEMNGSLTSPGVYPGLISPQMSAAAAAAYGRSPIVTIPDSPLRIYSFIYSTLTKKSPQQHLDELSSVAVGCRVFE